MFRRNLLPPSSMQKRDASIMKVETVRFSTKVKLSLCLTDSALRHEDVWGSGCIHPTILNLGTS
jgi:hypothetical protein